MSNLTALILGLIQGLTEFLPVSSSGHLVLFQTLFSDIDASFTLIFDITVHMGTLVAVLFYFFDDVKKLFSGFMKNIINYRHLRLSFKNDVQFRLSIYLLISTFVTGVIGIFFKDKIEGLFHNTFNVAVCLIFTGIILFISERIQKDNKKLDSFGLRDALLIGLFQSLALMPGISRSGTTIACALVLGFKQDESAKYSFLLAVPAIAGAFILQVIDIGQTGFETVWMSPLVLGFIISAVSGVFAIKLIMLFLHKKKLFVFSIYCWAVASLFLLTR